MKKNNANVSLTNAVDFIFLNNNVAEIKQKGINAKLVITGDGPQKESLEKLIKKLKLENNVFFLGYRKDIPDIISTFDIGCLISNYENFSMALLEYIAMNKLCLVSNSGGNPEVVNDAIAKFVDNPHDIDEFVNRTL